MSRMSHKCAQSGASQRADSQAKSSQHDIDIDQITNKSFIKKRITNKKQDILLCALLHIGKIEIPL